MKTSIAIKLIAASAGIAWATASFSHVSLENRTAPGGTSYKAVLQVGHGCEGSATRGLSVQIPAGFRGAKPMPKPGWAITTEKATLATPYDNHGKAVTEDVIRITWKADNKKSMLPDAHFDQFTLRGRLHDAAGPMWFKVLQTCEKGQNDWNEVPVAGSSVAGLAFPAALLDVSGVVPAGAALSPVATAAPGAPLQVSGAWVRTSVTGQKGTGAFMKITAKDPMRLVGISSPVAGVAEVHEMKMDGDVMRMRAIPGLDLPAGNPVELKPGGYHLMLMDLKQPLTVGTMVPVTLFLKDAKGAESRFELKLPVSAVAPPGAAADKTGSAAHKH